MCRFCAKRGRPGIACALTDVAHPSDREIAALFDVPEAWSINISSEPWRFSLWGCPTYCGAACPLAHRHGQSGRTPSHLEVLRDREVEMHEAAAALAVSRADLSRANLQLEAEGPHPQRAALARLRPFEKRVAKAEEMLRGAEAALSLADAEWRTSDVRMRALLVAVQAGYGEELRMCRGLDRAAHRDEIFWRYDMSKLRGPPGFEKSLLMAAAERNDHRAVLRLISLGADVNQRDPHGQRALHFAAHKKRGGAAAAKVARVLLGYGADVDAKDSSGCTALSYVAGAAYMPIYRPRCQCRDTCWCGIDFFSSRFKDWRKEDLDDHVKAELAAVLLQHGADPTGISSPRSGLNMYTPVKYWRVESLMRTFEAERARLREAREYERSALGPAALAYLDMQ